MFDFYQGMNSASNTWSMIELMYKNIDNFTTPGYKTGTVNFEEMMHQGLGLGAFQELGGSTYTQGKIRKTGSAFDLAIQEANAGNPCSNFFVLSDGKRTQFTRAGHFSFTDGKLVDPFSHWQVQGYALDKNGNKCGTKLQDISLPYDPNTKLYGGQYTGFKIGDGGKLYGEVRLSDPLTKQSITKTVPIYQVALASFSDPSALKQVSSTTFELSGDGALPHYGLPGEGAVVGQVVSHSLEMSNVDIPNIAQNIIVARMSYEGQVAAFKSLVAMTQTATNLVK